MGQSQSSVDYQELGKFPPPVQTRDQLLQKYAKFLPACQKINLHQRRWFKEMFNIFSTQSESEKFWSEESLANFMKSTLSSELTPVLMDAIPILHRCLLRLGSFPYYNDPEKLLTHDILRTAVIWVGFLYAQTDENAPFIGKEATIAFQVLAKLDPGKVRNEEQRSEEDDHYLENVLDRFQIVRRIPGKPKMGYVSPRYPSSHFPSPWASDVDQIIPVGEFRSFLRLMLVLNLFSSGIDAGCFSTCLPQVEKSTDCLLAAFQPSSNHGISWERFVHAAEDDVPYMFLGFMRLLGPLLCPKPLPQGSLPSSVVETQKFIKKSYVPSFQRDEPSPGYIFNLPLLGQLGLMLPRRVPEQGMSVSWSATRDQINLGDMRDQITQNPPLLILVSGHSNQDQHVTFGLSHPRGFIRRKYDMVEAIMFQVEPVQRAFHIFGKGHNDYSIHFDLEEENPTITSKISREDKRSIGNQSVMSLKVNSKGLGHFMIQAHNLPKVNEYFHVDAMELVKCDFQEIFVDDYEYCYHNHEDDNYYEDVD